MIESAPDTIARFDGIRRIVAELGGLVQSEPESLLSREVLQQAAALTRKLAGSLQTSLEQEAIEAATAGKLPHKPQPAFWTAQQVAKRWGCSSAMIYGLGREGKIPIMTLGKNMIRFRPEDVYTYEATHLFNIANQD